MRRRRLLAAIAASGTVAVAGCAGDDESYAFDAAPAQVPPQAAADAGYEGREPQSYTLEREFSVAGVNAQVSATTWATGYQNRENESALFVASTPNAMVGGESVNPLVQADETSLVRRLLEQASQRDVGGAETDVQIHDIEERGSETRSILDQEVEISILEATVTAEFNLSETPNTTIEERPMFLYVATVQHDEDVVALVGVHPTAVDARDSVLALMETVAHPAET